jgi:hypothetical protein
MSASTPFQDADIERGIPASELVKVAAPGECTCAAKDMPFGRCCKVDAIVSAGVDALSKRLQQAGCKSNSVEFDGIKTTPGHAPGLIRKGKI